MVIGQRPFNLNLAVTPSDTVNLASFTTQGILTSALYVGTGGDVVTVGNDGVSTTWKAVPTGWFLPIAAIRVNGSGTSASNIVACYWV